MYVFFGLQRPFSFLPDTTVWLTAGTVRAVKQTVVSLIITRNVNVPWYDSLDERAHCAPRSTKLSYLAEAGNALSFNTRVYGEK